VSFKSGFVSIIGRPNVGKSTLINQILGQKIAIMSDKPQTTRNKIHGVLTDAERQIIFMDTPGMQKPRSALGKYMLKATESALGEVDLILFCIDGTESIGGGDRHILQLLKQVDTPTMLIVNKIDRLQPEDLLKKIVEYKDEHPFAEVIPVSALNGNNVTTLLEQISNYLPEGPMYYPADQVTDHPEQFICAELIREKILHLTHDEVPHSIAVIIEQMKTREDGIVDIDAAIFVERNSQKGIVIGKKGALLKQVGEQARHDIERLLGSKIFLQLWVKVQKDWRNRDRLLKELGYRDYE
jgi:GTP-binding protein Era